MSDDTWSIEHADDLPEDDLLLLEAELGRLARDISDEDVTLVEPPVELWSMISSAATAPVASAASDAPGGSEIVDLAARREARRPWSGALVGIAAALLVLVAGVAALTRLTGDDEGQLLAQAEVANTGLPVSLDGSGIAELKRDGDDLYLELGLPDLPSSADQGAYYEVWMIDTDVEGMISLGGLAAEGGTVRVDLPDNVDHHEFPVVDISVEPLDGDPTHSGQSVLRGVLVDSDGA